MKNKSALAVALLVGLYIFGLTASAYGQQCLIVRSAEGHRFRNSMIAGALTGGVGFVAGAAFSGGKYEYVDSINFPNPKLKYKGKELKTLQEAGVHIVVINKKAQSDETQSARQSCKDFIQGNRSTAPAQTATPATSAPATPQATSAPAQTGPSEPPAERSVADAAREYQAKKASQQPPPEPKPR